jgi:hypothetical protein
LFIIVELVTLFELPLKYIPIPLFLTVVLVKRLLEDELSKSKPTSKLDNEILLNLLFFP